MKITSLGYNQTNFQANLIKYNLDYERYLVPAIREMKTIFADIPNSKGDTVLLTKRVRTINSDLSVVLSYYRLGEIDPSLQRSVVIGNDGTGLSSHELDKDCNEKAIELAKTLADVVKGK